MNAIEACEKLYQLDGGDHGGYASIEFRVEHGVDGLQTNWRVWYKSQEYLATTLEAAMAAATRSATAEQACAGLPTAAPANDTLKAALADDGSHDVEAGAE